MRTPIWTLSEIQAREQTGNWFFGLVRDDTGIRPCEIFPGSGYAYGWYWKDWPQALLDVWWATRR